MKKQILFVMAFYCLKSSVAQPVLNAIENFHVGMKIITYNIPPAGVNSGPAGASLTWNFSSLTLPNDTAVMEILAPAATPYGASFPTAIYTEKHGDGGLAYIGRQGSTLQMLGFVPAGAFVMWYHDPYTFLKEAFTYLDILDDTSRRGYKLAGDTLVGTGHTRTIADGWGTLILPTGTFHNVLRLKFEQDFTDTSQMNSVVTHSRIASYAWFDTTHRSALLKIDSVLINNPFYQDTTVDVHLLKREETVGVGDLISQQPMRAYYSGQQLIISGELKKEDAITISICDIAGRQVDRQYLRQQQPAHSRVVDLSHLSPGHIYLARIGIARGSDQWTTAVKLLR